jgi:hypothetical protein
LINLNREQKERYIVNNQNLYKRMEKLKKERTILLALAIAILLFSLTLLVNVNARDPEGPTSITLVDNETKGTVAAQIMNISGGRIATLNISATIQNTRWKAFVGWVTGSFTLDDSTGSTIYDWSLSTTNGRVYASRKTTAVTWASIRCANITDLELENILMNHSSQDDNITKTFSAAGNANHTAFYAGSTYFAQNACNNTVNTYVENATQSGTAFFEEVALYDASYIVYATILEQNQTGFDSNQYDFQMLAPENGLPGFTGSTAYWLYIEIT